jgi:hypothetical protein
MLSANCRLIKCNAVRPGGSLECVRIHKRTAKRIRVVERDAHQTAAGTDGVT